MAQSPAVPAERPLAVTMGDPAGIGPDITLLSWLRRSADACPVFFVAGDAAVFADRAKTMGQSSNLPVQTIDHPEEAEAVFPNALPVLPLKLPLGPVIAGRPDGEHAAAIIASIEQAVALTIAGRASAVVTNPIAKYVLMESGFAHAGHTEFLAELAERHGNGGLHPVMLMASKRLMAVPVTVHIALKDVPSAITPELLIRVATIVNDAFSRYFGIPQPRLAVCGLNPHAGENGALGREEIEIVAPALAALKTKGILASGPHPADTLFHDAARQQYDVVLAMYHDQALIPFKTLAFEDGVNVTLGLPFIRTSPDHGTAFALAGTGRANPASFIEALQIARKMSMTAPAIAPAYFP